MVTFPDYFAFGAHKVPPSTLADPRERVRCYQHMLCRTLNLRTVVAFVGAGCSAAFGYPTWEGLALEMIGRTREAVPAFDERLASFLKVLASYKENNRPCPADQLTLFIAVCKSILIEDGKVEIYKELVAGPFDPNRSGLDQNPPDNPYKELFALDIRRFVTTNYDVELERNLIRERNLEPDASSGLRDLLRKTCEEGRPGRQAPLRSFSHNTSEYEQLALFSLAQVRGLENAVFHCHGRFDDALSLIASEKDYQSWYFSEDDARRTFRQTIELLLGSNPLLFVGYGLSDDDLLRPLRHINALDSKHKHSRPLFALVRLGPGDEIRDEVLYERYGVHVIPYHSPEPYGPIHTRALCETLRELKDLWATDAAEWIAKPKARASRLGNLGEASYVDNLQPTEVQVGRIKSLEEEVCKPGLIGLCGPAGAGKSLCLLRIMDSNACDFKRRFYWNAHYGTEFLPAFDDILAYFHATDPQESRHENLQRILRSEKLLLIIDGCERFLHQAATPDSVMTYSSGFNLLLKLLDDPGIKSTVIVAGRVLPTELIRSAAARGWPRIVPVCRLVSADLQRIPAFNGIWNDGHRTLVTGLCSLLRGHNYGLRLAEHFLLLGGDEREVVHQRLAQLNFALATRPPNQRLSEMVRLFIAALDQEHPDLYHLFLERLARFVGPVCLETCELCYEAAKSETKQEGTAAGLAVVLGDLLKWELIFKMRRSGTGSEENYCVHATVRSMLLLPRHGLVADALPDFGISGFTSGRIDAYPDPERRGPIEDIFNRILERGETKVRGSEPAQAAVLCMDAFSLLRGTMAANTAPRGSIVDAYNRYLAFGIRLARLTKAVCEMDSSVGSWSYCEYFDREIIESAAAPLHVCELAWLYNDLGLALSAEGLLRDSYSVWEQAFEISRVMEHFDHGGAYRVEVLLNLTHVFIEMGRLRDARAYLKAAEEFNEKLRDADFEGRILGFRGFLAHLSGNMPEADSLYTASARRLRRGNNLRAQSVFHKHHADLRMAMGDLERGDLLIRRSRALAEAGVFPDLVAFARVSGGHLLALLKRYNDSRLEYESLLGEAQRMGSRKLEAECQATLSVLSLQERDVQGARTRAMQALSIANELGLGLRLTHSMIILGQATVRAGQRSLGIAYLRNAVRLASEQEYWHRRWTAEAALQELGERA